ncbi:MAG: hypothetical protein QUS11_06590 [Candidatus Fermentibacter sp.]|nr:hypothetical protein [Candidatus Fermentibacter sp.]
MISSDRPTDPGAWRPWEDDEDPTLLSSPSGLDEDFIVGEDEDGVIVALEVMR